MYFDSVWVNLEMSISWHEQHKGTRSRSPASQRERLGSDTSLRRSQYRPRDGMRRERCPCRAWFCGRRGFNIIYFLFHGHSSTFSWDPSRFIFTDQAINGFSCSKYSFCTFSCISQGVNYNLRVYCMYAQQWTCNLCTWPSTRLYRHPNTFTCLAEGASIERYQR